MSLIAESLYIESKRIETADSVFKLFNAGMFNARWLSQQALYFIQDAAVFCNAIQTFIVTLLIGKSLFKQ